jgi:hypothetical protein
MQWFEGKLVWHSMPIMLSGYAPKGICEYYDGHQHYYLPLIKLIHFPVTSPALPIVIFINIWSNYCPSSITMYTLDVSSLFTHYFTAMPLITHCIHLFFNFIVLHGIALS